MSLSLYEVTVPTLIRGLNVLSDYVDAAAKFAADKGGEPSALITARLAPDMMTFAGQIQRASNTSKGAIAAAHRAPGTELQRHRGHVPGAEGAHREDRGLPEDRSAGGHGGLGQAERGAEVPGSDGARHSPAQRCADREEGLSRENRIVADCRPPPQPSNSIYLLFPQST